ncbi:LysR family transcriptional regulator [Aliiglaciecola sp. 3_MG-2023]|uniref:LysR family transcriptional regulator n=1 Tax=Aliiglaciecola sp. 3_MG-2023 TaxID=3062644 RepID=UPI0026E39AAB|nr:LysR family transcriptional regulator [Aliiglaciecola sp. 3_MG-2023]MDO6695263.1 LysR family transcriptional regulator [Aliiglaciecola sp. 3_MG-2023]
MDLNNIQLFVEVVKRNSFAEVARMRNIDPSSVSRSIRKLETTLGFRLFQRTTRKLSPTEAGKSYFRQVEGLVDTFIQAGERALDLSNQPIGTLRVTACTSFGQKKLVPLLPIMRKKYPKLIIELVLADNQVDIVEQQIDAAIRFGKKPTDDFICKELAPRKFIVCASPAFIKSNAITNNPFCLSELECLRFSIPGYREAWKFRQAKKKELVVPVTGHLLISHGMTMTASAVAGLGVALLPDWLCRDELNDGSLVELFSDYECAAADFDTSAWVVYSSRDYMPLKLSAFIDCLKNEIPEFAGIKLE